MGNISRDDIENATKFKGDIEKSMKSAFNKEVNELVQEYSIMRASILEHKRVTKNPILEDIKLWGCINE